MRSAYQNTESERGDLCAGSDPGRLLLLGRFNDFVNVSEQAFGILGEQLVSHVDRQAVQRAPLCEEVRRAAQQPVHLARDAKRRLEVLVTGQRDRSRHPRSLEKGNHGAVDAKNVVDLMPEASVEISHEGVLVKLDCPSGDQIAQRDQRSRDPSCPASSASEMVLALVDETYKRVSDRERFALARTTARSASSRCCTAVGKTGLLVRQLSLTDAWYRARPSSLPGPSIDLVHLCIVSAIKGTVTVLK